MPIPLIVWGALGVAGLYGAGYAAKRVEGTTKWLIVGGGLLVSYSALKSAGVLK